MELLKEGKRNYYKNYKDFLDKILPEWDSDNIIIDLVCNSHFVPFLLNLIMYLNSFLYEVDGYYPL